MGEMKYAEHTVDPGIHAEKGSDAVGDQYDAFIPVLQLFYRRADFRAGFLRRKGLIVQAENLAIRKQRFIVLTLLRASAFPVNV